MLNRITTHACLLSRFCARPPRFSSRSPSESESDPDSTATALPFARCRLASFALASRSLRSFAVRPS